MSKPTCILQSPLMTRSGYGDWSLAVAKSLLRYDKFDLSIVPTPWGACSRRNLDEVQNDPEGQMLLNKVLRAPLNKQPDLFIQMTIPNEYMAPAKYNIGMTAGIETTVPRPEWIEGLNRMNLNIITSTHSRDVFAKAVYNKTDPNGAVSPLKVEKPMEVLFWGADTKIYSNKFAAVESVDKMLAEMPESFGFLFVGQWTSGNMASDRKSIGFLIKTFLETFRDIENPPCLILKTSGAQICVMDKYDCLSKINEVTSMVQSQFPNSKLPKTYLLHGELTDEEMNALYNHTKVKVHVSFTHGEGFGHPLLLSTLSGKPLLSSRWSGHLDFLNPAYTKFFEGRLVPIPGEAVNDWFVKEAQWFEADYEAAGRKMKKYFMDYSNDILDNAEKLRAENAEKFSLQAMDKAFHAMLDEYVPKFSVEQTIVLPKLKKLNLPKLSKLPTETTVPPKV